MLDGGGYLVLRLRCWGVIAGVDAIATCGEVNLLVEMVVKVMVVIRAEASAPIAIVTTGVD